MNMAISATQKSTQALGESQVLPGKGGWPVAGLGILWVWGRRRANGRETRLDPPLSIPALILFLFFFLFFFLIFLLLICSHAHTPRTKRGRLALSIRTKDLSLSGSPPFRLLSLPLFLFCCQVKYLSCLLVCITSATTCPIFHDQDTVEGEQRLMQVTPQSGYACPG